MIAPVPHLAAMAPYALADLGPPGTVSLAQNESAFPPSPKAVQAGQTALAQAALYPDPDWSELRAAISAVHGVDRDRILCGAGSMELISALVQAYAPAGSTVLGSALGYAFVATAAAQVQARYLTVPEPNLHIDPAQIARAVTEDTRIVFVCNPGNPTGTRVSGAEIVALRQMLPGHVLLVVDQAYGEFADAADPPAPVFDLISRGDTVITRTFSKAYGLAGARVGWALAPLTVGAEMRKLLNPNNVSGVSQAMATAAMRDQDHMRDVVRQTTALREGFARSARALGIEVPDSHTNFVLLRFASGAQAARVDQALRSAGLLLRAMGGYGLPEALRATVVAKPHLDRVLAVLQKEMS